jgi:hypothetical protein
VGSPGQYGDAIVITTAELHRLAGKEELRFDQTEKEGVGGKLSQIGKGYKVRIHHMKARGRK